MSRDDDEEHGGGFALADNFLVLACVGFAMSVLDLPLPPTPTPTIEAARSQSRSPTTLDDGDQSIRIRVFPGGLDLSKLKEHTGGRVILEPDGDASVSDLRNAEAVIRRTHAACDIVVSL
jgi:hypothetical protein